MAYQKDAGKKEINTTEVVKYLARSFNRSVAASNMSSKAVRIVNGRVNPTELYQAQVDMCYMLDNIQRGPAYIAPKYIQKANELIDKIAEQ